jgi:uncharacterized protein YndB with AHSA1/START domain
VPRATSPVEHEVRIAARPETVFGYFTDPAKMAAWMGRHAILDPRPGGVCRVEINDAAAMLGEFVRVEPYSRVEFTWGWEQDLFDVPPRSTAVEVSLIPDGAGTIVRISHRRLPDRSIAAHRAGWEHYLPRLAAAATGDDAGPDPWIDVRSAAGTLGALFRADPA